MHEYDWGVGDIQGYEVGIKDEVQVTSFVMKVVLRRICAPVLW